MECEMVFTQNEKETLLNLSRKTLKESFHKSTEEIIKEFLNSYKERNGKIFEPFPCFVTLHEKSGALRGCIGCTETKRRLIDNVVIYTVYAAFEDSRFLPVEENEIDNLIIDISVLGPLKKLPNLEAVKIGKHGLMVEKLHRHGLLLATVAVEYGWDINEFLIHTYHKAGLEPNEKGASIYYFEQVSFSERDFKRT